MAVEGIRPSGPPGGLDITNDLDLVGAPDVAPPGEVKDELENKIKPKSSDFNILTNVILGGTVFIAGISMVLLQAANPVSLAILLGALTILIAKTVHSHKQGVDIDNEVGGAFVGMYGALLLSLFPILFYVGLQDPTRHR